MPSTMNITRSMRRENEAGLTGSEAVSVENVGIPDQVISAGTEEQTALGAFKDHQLQTLCLLCDQAVDAQFLGVRYALTSTGADVAPLQEAVLAGDLTQEIFPGDLVRVEGTVGNDGVYLVLTVVFAAATTITVVNGMTFPGAEGAVGTLARVCSQQTLTYAYAVTSTTLGTGAIVYTGNVSDKFAAGDYLILTDTIANDGYYYIISVTTDGPPVTITTLIVSDPNIAVPVGALPATEGAVGYFANVRAAFALAANVPFMWSVDSGQPNPFLGPADLAATDQWFAPAFNAYRGDVTYCMVNNPGAVNANFAGRIGTNAII